MSEHVADIVWKRNTDGFGYDEYDRNHEWRFDGGASVTASASPAYRGKPEAVDPEEALVAAISSCHLLTFLALASKKRLVVDSYEDHAVGRMEKNEEGRLAVTRVDLHPKVTFATDVDAAALEKLHHDAHEQCFIANSVKTKIVVLTD